MASRKLLAPRMAVYQDGRGSEPRMDVGSVFPGEALNIVLGPSRSQRAMRRVSTLNFHTSAPRPSRTAEWREPAGKLERISMGWNDLPSVQRRGLTPVPNRPW